MHPWTQALDGLGPFGGCCHYRQASGTKMHIEGKSLPPGTPQLHGNGTQLLHRVYTQVVVTGRSVWSACSTHQVILRVVVVAQLASIARVFACSLVEAATSWLSGLRLRAASRQPQQQLICVRKASNVQLYRSELALVFQPRESRTWPQQICHLFLHTGPRANLAAGESSRSSSGSTSPWWSGSIPLWDVPGLPCG